MKAMFADFRANTINVNSGQVALIGMNIHHKLSSTDNCFLFLTFRLILLLLQ